jgi:4-cresol dehydrogenase (hydroxylating)
MSETLLCFIAACRACLGENKIHLPSAPLSGLEGFKRQVGAVVEAASTDEVQAIVELANKFAVPLFPTSTGKNWGFGSRLPVKDDCVILDLKAMNKIRELNLEFGYAVIEPGVTQLDLAEAIDALAKSTGAGSKFYLDVTGAGAETSVIGNTLEKGIAYNSLRADNICNLEVVLGNGRVIRTGFGHRADSQVSSLFRHGVGPSFDGLFLQSNFGVVTSATVHLLPQNETHKTLSMLIRPQNLSQVIEVIPRLLRDGLIQGIPHIGNSERIRTTFAPLCEREYLRRGQPLTRPEIERRLEKALPQGWSMVASLRGKKSVVRAMEKEISQALRGLGFVAFMGDERPGVLARLGLQIMLGREAKILMAATEGIRALTFGRPSNDGIEAVQWSRDTKPGSSIDDGPRGFLFCTPLAPLSGPKALKMNEIAHELSARHGFSPGITLNAINDKTLEAVISIAFDRQAPSETSRAHACIQDMNRRFISEGMTPYRVNIDFMNELVDGENPYWRQVADLKSALDPNHVIAPNRYNLR